MTSAVIEVGIAQHALGGGTESGDRCVVKVAGDRALIGVIDGIGHGAQAAAAAEKAADVLLTFSHEPVSALMARCHERLKGTRGAAITLVALDAGAGQLQWLGAGNVAAVLLHMEPTGLRLCRQLFARSGVAGAKLLSTVASMVSAERGDIVALATDGVSAEFVDDIDLGLPSQQLAEQLLARYRTAHDDALVVVARVQGQAR